MARLTDNPPARAAATGSARDPIDLLLDRLHVPLPSEALRLRIYRLAGAGPTRRGILGRALPHPAVTPIRPWAIGAAAAAAVVTAAYLTDGERTARPTPALVAPASTLALQYGAVHPAEATASPGAEADEPDDDAYALQDADEDELDLSLI
jgi:hypothetical protein